MAFNIVLVNPLIPQNTGNIGRLFVATHSILHLIDPLGFDLSDKYLNRAGLDYWKHLEYYRYENMETFLTVHGEKNSVVFSSKAKKVYWDYSFSDGDFLIFGNEEKGVSIEILNKFHNRCLTIPQSNDKVRCLNLANSVSISLYEALRQTRTSRQ
jgi:tRNA (cytidine/uridine-2'-O-)-methyltransferase